jgi:hypothetical protein
MSALQLTITAAGRNALVNAANTGTLPLIIDRVVLGSGMYVPDQQQVALHMPIKPITAFGGTEVADDIIHITITDDSSDNYVLGEIGLYAGNVLFGIYSQPTAILEKGASQLVLLSADIQFTSLPAGSVTVGDTQFAYPKATETRLGVIEIATAEEVAAGTDPERAVTPKTLAPQLLTRLGKTEAAVSAAKWTTSRKLTLTGDVSGYASWDGSGDISLDVTVSDNSHAHTIANVTGLQTALDAKLTLTGNAASASKLATARTIALSGGATGTATSFDGTANISISVTGLDATKMNGVLPDANLSGTYTGVSITGNAATASTLQTARAINGVSFNGAGNITVEPYVELDTTTNASRYLTFVDGSAGGYSRLNLDTALSYNPSTKQLGASVTGNAATATKLAAARTITLAGNATGSASFDGSANITLTVDVADNSHAHSIANVSGLQTALDAKLAATANAVSASKWATARTISLSGGATGSFSIDGSANAALVVTVVPTGHAHNLATITDSPYKEAADAATTAALTVTATTTTLTNATTMAALVIDGVTMAVGQRLLVKNQSSAAQNGIYTVTSAGSTTANWVLTRAVGSDTSAEIAGAVITVDSGAINGACLFSNDFKKTSTLGSTAMNWRSILDTGNISSLHHASGVAAGTYRSVTVNTQGHVTAGTNPTTLAGYGITDALLSNGNAVSATKLAAARTIALSGAATGTATAFDGSANIAISVTSLAATSLSGIVPDANLSGTYTGVSITGNAATATKLAAAKGIYLSGDVSGYVSFDGSNSVYITTTLTPGERIITLFSGASSSATVTLPAAALAANSLLKVCILDNTSMAVGELPIALMMAYPSGYSLSIDYGDSADFICAWTYNSSTGTLTMTTTQRGNIIRIYAYV